MYNKYDMNMKKVNWIMLLLMCLTGSLFAQQNLYVSTQGDDAADGSASAPLRTIARALALADDNGTVIRVASGNYAESQTLDLRSNLTIEGGLDATTWHPDGLATTITVDALQSVLDYNQKIAFRSMGANHWTLIRLRMAVTSATAADRAYSGKGASTYVLLINGDADDNQLIDCELLCGNGGDGISGTTGAAGASASSVFFLCTRPSLIFLLPDTPPTVRPLFLFSFSSLINYLPPR